MPSPIGHALGAFVCGWIVAGPAPTNSSPSLHGRLGSRLGGVISPANVPRVLGFAALGLVADFDLFAGYHSACTHSIGAAGLVFVGSLTLLGRERWLLAAGAAAAYFSHPAFDWLGEDGAAPYGVMLWWPFSNSYHYSGLEVFRSIERRYWLPGFWVHNISSIARELALLVPAAAVAVLIRAPRGRARDSGTAGSP